MIEKLEKLYKMKMSFPIILFDKRKVIFYIFMGLDICLLLGSSILYLLKLKAFAIIGLISLIGIFTFYFWLAKTLLFLKYKIKTSLIPDFYKAVKDLRIKILKNCLTEEKSLDKIDRIITVLKKKANDSKMSTGFNTGLFILLFLPLWEQMISQITKGVDLFNYRNFIPIFSIITIIYWLIWYFKCFKDAFYELIDFKSQKYNVLIDLLEEILLEI